MRPTKHPGGTANFGRGTVGSRCDLSCGGVFKDQKINLGMEADNVRPLHLPFACWPEEIVRYLKGSGTPFAHFVFRAFHCCRGDRHDAPPDALFPIPLPMDVLGIGSRVVCQRTVDSGWPTGEWCIFV